MPVSMDLEVDFCGKPVKWTLKWVVGKPQENAKAVVEHLMPQVYALVFPK
jgi:hypothetical protein